jgi:hypothetical protein
MSQERIPCHENVRLEITEKLLCFAAQWLGVPGGCVKSTHARLTWRF